MKLDLQELFADLPEDLRVFANYLQRYSLSEIARMLQVPRTTLQRRVSQLRKRFENAGLKIYLEN
ncbi:MAG: helix-turn-helix domain-containing protein [Zavarzinella sp.]